MKKILSRFPILLTLLIGCFCLFSEPLQAKIEPRFISTEDLNEGLKDQSLFVIDCNLPEVFKKGHIPTAIHMDSTQPQANLLPKDKTAALVFYCKNPRCLASHDGAEFAIREGYKNVRVYPLGIEGWEKAKMPVEAGK